MDTYLVSIYDAGIQFLQRASIESVNAELSDSLGLDISYLGYEHGIDNPGKKHRLTVQEVWDRFPVLHGRIRKNSFLACQVSQISSDEIFNLVNNSPWQVHPWDSLKSKLTEPQLDKLGCPDEYLSDDWFPYRNLSDEEIFQAIPDIIGLSGNRTEKALFEIRRLRKPVKPLSDFHVLYKKTWRESKTDIRIGQTNGSGGYCKEACFLSWA